MRWNSIGNMVALGLSVVSVANAAITVGDPAPKLETGEWVQGQPINEFDSNHVYLVEFWATWCQPCRAAIPHVNKLAQTLQERGLVVIGLDVWDSDESVAPFVRNMGSQMSYRVALDDKSRKAEGFMAGHWWKRGVDGHGIPVAFVIDRQGRIAWMGHPMALNEKLLGDVLADRYDLRKAVTDYQKQQRDEAQWDEVNGRLTRALDGQRWNKAASALDELLNRAQELKFPPGMRDGYASVRLRILLGEKKHDEACRFANAFSDSHPTDAARQNTLAWMLVTQKEIEHTNLVIAKKLAERANAAARGTDSAILDTLARVLFLNGERSGAIAMEQRALDAAPEQEKARCRVCLADYQAGRLPAVKE